jgi:hypothetical protein
MYALKEEVGEAAVNRALQKLLAQFAFKGAPYPASTDFLRLLRAEVAPAQHGLITDLFEKITLYDLKASAPKVQARSDGKFDVRFTVQAAKFYSDGKGKETAAPLSESFEIGAFSAELPRQTQWPLDGDAAVAKLVRGKNFAGEGFDGFELGVGGLAATVAFWLCGLVQRLRIDHLKVAKAAGDGGYVTIVHHMALAAQRFAHLAAEVDAVDELHLAFALGGLFVRQHPHIGGNASILVFHGRPKPHECTADPVIASHWQ